MTAVPSQKKVRLCRLHGLKGQHLNPHDSSMTIIGTRGRPSGLQHVIGDSWRCGATQAMKPLQSTSGRPDLSGQPCSTDLAVHVPHELGTLSGHEHSDELTAGHWLLMS